MAEILLLCKIDLDFYNSVSKKKNLSLEFLCIFDKVACYNI